MDALIVLILCTLFLMGFNILIAYAAFQKRERKDRQRITAQRHKRKRKKRVYRSNIRSLV